jgi:hypothetical protein
MNVLKPQNPIEKKILSNKEFLTAIKIGKSRQYHLEGTTKAHIIQILEYIEKKYSKKTYYNDLRIIALLHDVGKFAFLEDIPQLYMPKLPYKECKILLLKSQKFKKKYYNKKNIPKELKKYMFTPVHAYVSYVFAKKFLKEDKMLKLILYHDLTMDMMIEYKKTNKYDTKLFKKVFSNIDLNIYLAFLKCDSCNSIDEKTKWIKLKLKNNNINIPK